MSIVSVNEIADNRGGIKTLQATTYKRLWKVTTDAVTDNAAVVLAATGLPEVGEEMEGDPAATMWKMSADPVSDTRLVWIVTANYSTPVGSSGGNRFVDSEDPLEQPAQIGFQFATKNKVVDKSYTAAGGDGAITDLQDAPTFPIWNSTLVPFDPPLTQDYSYVVINIRQNREEYDPQQSYQFINTMNRVEIQVAGLIIPVRAGLLVDYSGMKAWDVDGDPYWVVTFAILVDFDTHVRNVLDAGITAWDGVDYVTRKDADGLEMTDPSPLDGSGVFLVHGNTPVYRPFVTYFDLDWRTLDLPEGTED